MYGMRIDKLNDLLREQRVRVFSIYDASKFISKPNAYASKLLARDRYVKRVERGMYYTKDASEYEVASRVVFPSYVSLISALRFHNLTQQIPHIIFIVSPAQHRPIPDLNGFEVRFMKIQRRMLYGYGKVDDVFVADPEKAVIDMLYLNEFVDYAEETVESGRIDAAKLADYAERSGVKSVVKKVGAMLHADKKRT